MALSLVGAQQGFGTLSGNIRWTCEGKMKEIYNMSDENWTKNCLSYSK